MSVFSLIVSIDIVVDGSHVWFVVFHVKGWLLLVVEASNEMLLRSLIDIVEKVKFDTSPILASSIVGGTNVWT